MEYINAKIEIRGNNNNFMGYFVRYEDGRFCWQPPDCKWTYDYKSLVTIAKGLKKREKDF